MLKTIKTNELTGAALDWAVAKCEQPGYEIWRTSEWVRQRFHPSTDWSQGGLIIEREKMSTNYDTDYEYDPNYKRGERWVTTHPTNYSAFGRGTTALIAAMRCYVASKLGDEVEIPEELK